MKTHISPYVLPAILIIAWAGYMTLYGPIDWDLAWQFFLAKRILIGERLYVDVGVTEQHPPLYTWLCTAAAAIAQLMHVNPIRFFIGLSGIVVLLCAYAATRLLRGDALLMTAFGVAALSFNGFASGSGEELAVALALPYLATVVRRLQDDVVQSKIELIAGCLAGIGLAIKPHYALVWLFAELLVARKYGIRSLLRSGSLAVVVWWPLYVLATWLFTPEYFTAAKDAIRYYGAFLPQPLVVLLLSGASLYLCCAWILWAVFRRHAALKTVPFVLLCAATAFWIGALVQGKGWPHHWTPALGLTTAAIGALLPARRRELALAVLIIFGSYKLWRTSDGLRRAQNGWPTFLPGMTHAVQMFAPRGPVFIASVGLAPAFPLINNTGAEWSLTESSLWMIPGLYPNEWSHDGPYNFRAPQQWDAFERKIHELIWRGIEKRPPEIIFIERHRANLDFIPFFAQDPRMAAFLSQFVKVGTVGPFDVLLPAARTNLK